MHASASNKSKNPAPPSNHLRSANELLYMNLSAFQGADFRASKAFYATSFDLSNEHNQHHLRAWRLSWGEDCTDFGVIGFDDGSKALCFGSEDSRDSFYAWHQHYQGLFGHQDIEHNIMPSLIPGERTLIFVKPPEFTPENISVFLGWISANCKRPFYYTGSLIAFEDRNEAFSFEMRFKGT